MDVSQRSQFRDRRRLRRFKATTKAVIVEFFLDFSDAQRRYSYRSLKVRIQCPDKSGKYLLTMRYRERSQHRLGALFVKTQAPLPTSWRTIRESIVRDLA